MWPGNIPERRLGHAESSGVGGFDTCRITPRPGPLLLHTYSSHVSRQHPRTPTRPVPDDATPRWGWVSNLTKAWTNVHSHIVVTCGQATSQNADLAHAVTGAPKWGRFESHQGLDKYSESSGVGVFDTCRITPRPGPLLLHTYSSHVSRQHPRTPTRPR